MKDEKKREESAPEAKRSGREGVDPVSQPGEFADDMRVNRTTPPPEPEPAQRD
jgi:hypothetical protein